jgi:DNA mismatch repair protein MutS2
MSALTTLEFPSVLELIALEAKSEPGRAAVRRRIPLHELEKCEEAQSRLSEMVRYHHAEGLLPFSGLADTRAIFDQSDFDLPAAWAVFRSVRATQAVREALLRNRDPYPLLQQMASTIDDLDGLVRDLSPYFTRDGKLREEASATLRTLRTRIHSKRHAIQKSLDEIMGRNADAVQEAIVTIRNDRYCIPVRSDRRQEIPGILHERSGSGASVFIEPLAVLEANNDLADLLAQEREEIARLVRFIAQRLFAASEQIDAATAAAGELDAIQACAVISDLAGATRPLFTLERRLRIVDGRHPLLDERLADLRRAAFGEHSTAAAVVPNSLSIEPERPALMISGPNAGGKTVAIKTTGLLVAMATSGLPVPAAEGTVIPVVDRLHVLIGDDQNLLESLSTFSAYLHRLKRILTGLTAHSLVLLDELGSGTDPDEGAALAASVIEHAVEAGAMLVVTTHLTALKSFALEDGRVKNASMEFDAETGRPTFRLIEGLPGRSRAIETARIVGLPAAVIEQAEKRLGEEHGRLDHLLNDLQAALQKAREERLEAEREQQRLAAEQAEMIEERKRYEEERRKFSDRLRDEAERLRLEVTRRLEEELRMLRAADRRERERIAPREVIARVVAPLEVEPEAAAQKLSVGDTVEHRTFKLVGTLVGLEGDRARIAAGGKTMEVDARDLRVKAAAPKKESRPAQRPVSIDEEPVVGAELNLIGQRVDEAIDESEKFIDRALLDGTPALRLIHGFGTGKLRRALRENLRKHPAVRSYRPGRPDEGGDGATIVVLDL